MSDLSFAHSWVLLFLPVVLAVFALWVWGLRRGQALARALSRVAPAAPGVTGAVFLALAAAFAVVAAAQPRWGTTESSLPREGAELMIVMDVSRSMGATDVAPNRLTAAKEAIVRSLHRLGGDRVGLVIFAGEARLRFPLTTDFQAAEQVIRSLETGTVIVEGGSSTAAGLQAALDAFDLDRQAGRLIVLVTDGDNLGEDPTSAAERIRQAGVGFLVVGVGTPEGSTVPVFNIRDQRMVDKLDENGEPIITRLNESFLRSLASAGGGQYLGGNLDSVPGAIDSRIQALQRAELDRRAADIPIERFQWFAAAALGFLVLGSVAERLPVRVERRGLALAGAALAMVLLSACATHAYELNEQAREAMEQGDYDRAIALFTEAQAEEPDNPHITLNLAAALHAAGRYDEAQQTTRRVLASPQRSVRVRAHASLGHHRFAVNDLQGALESFKAALLEDPNDEDNRHDYEVVLRLLAQQGEQPGEPGDDGPGDPQQGEQGSQEGQQDEQQSPGPGQEGEQGEQQPGQQPSGSGDSAPATPREVQDRIDAIDAEVARLMQDSDGPPTAEEALRILDLLAERARLAGSRNTFDPSADPNDY